MIYQITVPQYMRTLNNLLNFMEKAEQFSTAKKIDTEILLNSRLAPDQFNFIKQVQIACDTAKLSVARVTGKEAPSHADNEKTLTELRQRVSSVISFLKEFSEKDFAEAKTRSITQPRWEGKTMTGENYIIQHAIPNFYFHITTAYAILRHNGVEVGKKDFLGELAFNK